MTATAKALCLLAVAVLSGCGASLGLSAWNHSKGECREAEEYGNGYWERDVFCRDGKGVIVWYRWWW